MSVGEVEDRIRGASSSACQPMSLTHHDTRSRAGSGLDLP